MFLLQEPPPTQYDLRFSVAGIPVRVHPLFWLVALLLGSSGALIGVPIWIFVLFVSILIHELGHAFACRCFGIDSRIVLHYMGGLAIPESSPWGGGWANIAPSPRQQIVISLAGPFAGFLLAIFVIAGVNFSGGATAGLLFGVIPVPQYASFSSVGRVLNQFIQMMLWVNIFWGLINLLPVFPLDGGQVARNVLIQSDPLNGNRKSLWVSVITGAVVAFAGFFLLRSIYMAVLFGLLAFQSYQALGARY